MSRLAWGLALVAVGHLVYVVGGLAQITASTLFDVATAILLGVAAWRARDAAAGIPGRIVPFLLALGPIEILDYGLSFGFGWQTYHLGFSLILLGALAISWGAWKLRGGSDDAKLVRLGAWLSAAGSLVYVGLAAQPFLFGGASSIPFLLGATAALVGWAQVALRAEGSWPSAHSTAT